MSVKQGGACTAVQRIDEDPLCSFGPGPVIEFQATLIPVAVLMSGHTLPVFPFSPAPLLRLSSGLLSWACTRVAYRPGIHVLVVCLALIFVAKVNGRRGLGCTVPSYQHASTVR